MGKIFTDSNNSIDENEEQIYLPESQVIGGSVATGGSIVVDSLSIPQNSQALWELDLSTIVDFSPFTADSVTDILLTDFTSANLFPSLTAPESFNPTNTSELITQLKSLIEASLQVLTSYDFWEAIPGTDYEFNLNDVAQTFSVRHIANGSGKNGILLTLSIDYNTDPTATIGQGVLTGGAEALSSTFQLDLGATTIATITEGTEYNTGDNKDTVIGTLVSAINAETDFTPGGASYDTGTDTLSIGTTESVSTYNGDLPAIVSNISAAKASIPFLVQYSTPIAGTIDFQIGSKTLSVTIDGTEADDVTVIGKITTAMSADGTWDYEYDSSQLISKQNGTAFNGTMYVITDTGLTFTIDGVVGQNDITFELSGGKDDILTTSSPVAMTGGSAPQSALTPSFQTIRKSRKISGNSGVINIKGFGSFVIISEWPVTQETQDAFFSLPANVVTVATNKGIGFTLQINTMADGTSIYIRLDQIIGSGAKYISDTVADHTVFKITRNAANLELRTATIGTPAKTTTNGWEHTDESDIILTADALGYVPGNFFRFTFPQAQAKVISVATLQNNAGQPGSVVDGKIISDTDNPSLISSFNTKLNNKTFAMEVIGDDSSDCEIGFLRLDGDS